MLVQTHYNPPFSLVDIVFLFLHVDVSTIEGLLEPKPIVPIRLYFLRATSRILGSSLPSFVPSFLPVSVASPSVDFDPSVDSLLSYEEEIFFFSPFNVLFENARRQVGKYTHALAQPLQLFPTARAYNCPGQCAEGSCPVATLLLKSSPVLVLARCVRARYVFCGDLCGISAG